jgi:hypothetical protein
MTGAPAVPVKHRTALVLIKSPAADATIDSLADSGITIHDGGTYWKLESHDDIRVDMAAVQDELGEPINVGKWLVTMSSYVGRVETGDDYFLVMPNAT